jgi:hypothetical protein
MASRETPDEQPRSVVGLWLLTILALGIGALLGFGIFAAVYRAECHQLIRDAQERALAQARAEFREQLEACQFHSQALRTQAEHHQTARENDVAQLRQSHDQNLQKLQESHQAQVQALVEQVNRLQRVREEAAHVEPPKNCCQDYSSLQLELQRRYLAQTQLKYHLPTSSKNQSTVSVTDKDTVVHVDLALDTGESELRTIVLELDRLHDMPMTTATFLYFVQAGFYTGVDIKSVPVEHSHLHTLLLLEHGSLRQAVADRWAAHGYHRPETPLLWANETSARQAPCSRYGFGVDWYARQGADIFVYLDYLPPSRRPCLGHVVQGQQWFVGKPVGGTLAYARIRTVSATESTLVNHSEL